MATEKKVKRKIYFSQSTGQVANGETKEIKVGSFWSPGCQKKAFKKIKG